MTSFRAAFLAALCSIFLASCGDTFRPIAIPEPGVQPTPQASKTAQVITGAGMGTVTNYNLSGGTLTGQANLGQGPSAAVLVGSRVFVANQTDNTLSSFSALSPQIPVPSTVTLRANASPVAMATPPNGTAVYVAYPNLDAIGIVSPVNNIELGVILLNSNGFTGNGPSLLLTDIAGAKLIVGNVTSNNISVIDLASNSVVSTIPCARPSGISRTPDAPYVYVTCHDSNNLLIVNSNTGFADYNIPVPTGPNSLAFDTANKRLILTSDGGSVSVLNENFSQPLALQHSMSTVAIGATPVQAVALPDGSRIYVATTSGNVVVVDSVTLTVRTNIVVGGTGRQIAASSDSTRVAVTTAGPDALQVIDTTTDTLSSVPHALTGPPKALLVF
jgi:YVTN family beta-propeller protein